ncbi:MAG: flavodoxin family protein [Anaerolineae bacterium]
MLAVNRRILIGGALLCGSSVVLSASTIVRQVPLDLSAADAAGAADRAAAKQAAKNNPPHAPKAVLIIYDTVYGNTELLARNMGQALGLGISRVKRVGDVTPGDMHGLKLLVVGSPTQDGQPLPALSAFIKGLPPGALDGVRTAVFDTHYSPAALDELPRLKRITMKIKGLAGTRLAKLLEEKGAQIADINGFGVDWLKGPLSAGELEQAEEWARSLNR